jgi:hypothetical protein
VKLPDGWRLGYRESVGNRCCKAFDLGLAEAGLFLQLLKTLGMILFDE